MEIDTPKLSENFEIKTGRMTTHPLVTVAHLTRRYSMCWNIFCTLCSGKCPVHTPAECAAPNVRSWGKSRRKSEPPELLLCAQRRHSVHAGDTNHRAMSSTTACQATSCIAGVSSVS